MVTNNKETQSLSKNFCLDLISEDYRELYGSTQEPEGFVLSNEQIRRLFKKNIYKEIISCKAFKRLKNIRFLGAIDYAFFPDKPQKRHSRYQHSLGVAKLALEYARLMNLPEDQEILSVTAALLHDIGHAPLSHSMESVFVNEFQIGHHTAGETIIKGDQNIGNTLWKILEKYEINHFEVMSIIHGYGKNRCFTDIFNHPINIDTIEGILRSESYFSNKHFVSINPSQVLHALANLANGDNSDIEIIDAFWRKKNTIYSVLINSQFGILADLVCQEYMKVNLDKFEKDCFYKTESELYREHASLFSELERMKDKGRLTALMDKLMPLYCKREFYIEDIAIHSVKELKLRYKQRKLKVEQIINKRNLRHAREFPKHSSSFNLL